MSSSLAGENDESAALRGLTTMNPATRICSYCGKRFGCGKALGGHMRIHRSRKSEAATAVADKNDLSSGEEISCKICGKKFESWRSVFGHMRAHPDREWRGMQSQPPPHCAAADPVSSANSLSSTVSDNHNQMHDSAATVVGPNPAADLTKNLSFWSVTGRRGRKGKMNAVPVSDDAVTSREPRLRLFKKKMRKLSDLETNHHQETYGSKQKSGYVTGNRHRKQLRRHGGSWNFPETESATTNSSVTSSTKNDMIIYKISDNKEILTACCGEELHHFSEHGGRKMLQIDLNELPIMEEEEDEGTESTH